MSGAMPGRDICELLPQYVAGTLADEEEWLVHEHLHKCRLCARDLTVLRAACDEMNRAPVPLVPEPDLERFRRALAREIQHSEPVGRQGSAGTHSPLPWLAAAALLLTVAAALWFSNPPSVRAPALYETATSGTAAANGRMMLEVEFAPGTSLPAARRLLEEAGAISVSEVGPRRLEVSFSAQPPSFEHIEAVRDRILAHEEVSGVRVLSFVTPGSSP